MVKDHRRMGLLPKASLSFPNTGERKNMRVCSTRLHLLIWEKEETRGRGGRRGEGRNFVRCVVTVW